MSPGCGVTDSSPSILMNITTSPDTTKRVRIQHCQRCENHDHRIKKSRHDCPLKDCRCDKCTLTTQCQKLMKHQQRFWRWRKQIQTEEVNGEEHNKISSKAQRCDRCRTHGINTLKKGHKGNCEFQSCPCEMCQFITKRQAHLKYNQRVKRNRSSHQQTLDDEEKVLPGVEDKSSRFSAPLDVADTQRLILHTSDAENCNRDFQAACNQKEITSRSLSPMSLYEMELEERRTMSMQLLQEERLRIQGLWPLVPPPLKPTPIFPMHTLYCPPSYITPYPYILLRERSTL